MMAREPPLSFRFKFFSFKYLLKTFSVINHPVSITLGHLHDLAVKKNKTEFLEK